MRRLRAVVPALVASALAASVAVGPAAAAAPAPASPAPPPASPAPPPASPAPAPAPGDDAPRFVALGDSWAAGSAAGALDAASGDCRRSTVAYPELLATASGEPEWVSVACATSRPDSANAQFDAIGPATRVVTATIGADAIRLGEMARACSTGGTAAQCDQAAAATDRALDALPAAMDASLRALRDVAPTATLALTGVPRPAEGRACATGPADAARAARLDAAADRLDEVLAARAPAWGGVFVDVRDAFAGHGVCADEPWLAPLTDPDPRIAGAATAEGHAQGYAAALAAPVATALAAPAVALPAPTPGIPRTDDRMDTDDDAPELFTG